MRSAAQIDGVSAMAGRAVDVIFRNQRTNYKVGRQLLLAVWSLMTHLRRKLPVAEEAGTKSPI